jgi:ABC-type hemin transport system ATPase subunit
LKLRRFQSRPEDADQEPFRLSFRRPTGDTNAFSILIGSNGTRKSRTLRDILDVSLLRSRDSGVTHEGKPGAVSFWRDATLEHGAGLSKILAISGVATDRFPSRITGRKMRTRPLTYAYVGPRSENNLVSRTQSINQIARSLLEHPDRVKRRHKQLRHAFSLLKVSHGIMFTLDRTAPPTGSSWTVSALRKRLLTALQEEEEERLLDDTTLVKRCVELMKSAEHIEFRLDLDDVARIDATPNDLQALLLLVAAGALTVSESYVYTTDNRQLNLSEFSSGQWQILSSLLFAAVAVEDNTLILIDEPENSLHPSWQQIYLPLLNETISSVRGVHVLVATHSPLVAASLDPQIAEVFQIRIVNGRLASRNLRTGPFGWTADQILQEVFGLHSARSVAFTKRMDVALSLFAKGDRTNPELKSIVDSLEQILPSLPEDDVAREIIATLSAVVNAGS